MKKLLISGFDAFGEDVVNPSMDIVKKLPNNIGDFIIYPLVLPTQAKASVNILKQKVEEIKPDYVVNIGLAKGRNEISLERVAINIDDFCIPDNAGKKYIDTPIEKDGMDGYFTNLAIKNLLKVMKEEGYRVCISNSAGTFVCNHVMYAMQHLRHTKYPNMKTGFIHVPFYEENNIGLCFEEMYRALICMIEHLHEDEIVKESGTVW